MKLASVLLLAITALAAPISLQRRNSRWDYQNSKVHGVNIGGWLVLEPYITPSLFEMFDVADCDKPVDEYHFTQTLGKTQAEKVLQNHWSTFYTEEDFESMASAGLNFVRIPIGYWAFALLDNDPYVQGQVEYLNQALSWCAKHNLKAWIDLHGVPGSQNGFDNSGLRDSLEWQSCYGYVDFTLNVIKQISETYSTDEYKDVVIGIELVNEPNLSGLSLDGLKEYYTNGYNIVRESGDVPVIIHDGFRQLDNTWEDFLNTQLDPNVWDVIMDHHHYQVFSVGELERSLDDKIAYACKLGTLESQEYHIPLIGEWSAALTDCAKWLNGVNRGARYDATYENSSPIGSCNQIYEGDMSYFQNEQVRQNYRRFMEAQMDAYQFAKISGWVFWCWKTESAVEWDFTKLLELNIIPQPLSAREFGDQCGYYS